MKPSKLLCRHEKNTTATRCGCKAKDLQISNKSTSPTRRCRPGTKKPRHRVTPGRVRRPPHQKGRSTKPGQASGLRGGGQDRRAGRTPLPSHTVVAGNEIRHCPRPLPHLHRTSDKVRSQSPLVVPQLSQRQHLPCSHSGHPGHGRRRSPMRRKVLKS